MNILWAERSYFGKILGAFLEGQSADVPEGVFEVLPLLLSEIFLLHLASLA